jgi:hypothetical protein
LPPGDRPPPRRDGHMRPRSSRTILLELSLYSFSK